MEVKKRKTEFKPYNVINNSYVTIMWDYKPIFKTNAKGDEIETPLAFWQEYTFKKVPSLSEIKNIILDYYNQEIDKKILSGMTWKGMKIWLSSENQFNYKVAYDLAIQTNGKNLPIYFKFGDTETPIYYEFKTIEDLTDFYLSSVSYIQKILHEGWQKKDSINWELFK